MDIISHLVGEVLSNESFGGCEFQDLRW